MKKLESLLQKDAKAFAQKPASYVHNSIMNSIKKEKVQISHAQSSSTNKWWLPIGFAVTAVLLIAVLFLPHHNKEINDTFLRTQTMNKFAGLDVSTLSKTMELNLINDMNKEKLALQKDLAYMQSWFIL